MIKAVLSPRLIMSHRVFQSGWLPESLCPDVGKNWVLVPLMHSEVLSALSHNSLTCMKQICTLLNIQEKTSAYLWSSLCMQFSAFWCSVLWILATLVSLNSQLCLLNSGRSLVSAPLMWSGNLLGLWYSSPPCFPSLSDHCPHLLMF